MRKDNEALGLPELYGMQPKKLFMTRLENYPDNLGEPIKGITKDINEISELITKLKKYGLQFHNVSQDMYDKVAKRAQTENWQNQEGFICKNKCKQITKYWNATNSTCLYCSNNVPISENNKCVKKCDKDQIWSEKAG